MKSGNPDYQQVGIFITKSAHTKLTMLASAKKVTMRSLIEDEVDQRIHDMYDEFTKNL